MTRKAPFFVLWLLTFFFVIACSNSTSECMEGEGALCSEGQPIVPSDTTETDSLESGTVLPEIEEMIIVRGSTVTLGSDDAKYRPSERPAMKVRLDYDFSLGVHEITCGEYGELAKKMVLKEFGKCENDSLPLSDVTYYDAILFANARSKSEGRDTAYTYSGAVYDTEGHCTNLEALAFHPERDAYRLPTEAEWALAASQGWNPAKYSWNADNSEYRAHAVCSAGADTLGFCDLAGNVKEWVNDWAGSFFDTTVTNYLGAPDGGDLGERVLKGGYFSEKISEMNVVARGDEYTVEASTRAARIGFRLAFGRIPNPVWLDAGGHAKASIVTPLAGASSLKAYTGTYNMVLAFRNDISGNIAYIDYRDGSLSVTEIEDSLEVYHPDISPDGKRVAFCTRLEGVAGKSALYVRDLDAEGGNLVKLDVESAAIPRWRVLGNGDTVIVYVTDAGNNKDETAFRSASTWQVKFAAGKFGTPEKLFDGAFHGGISKDNTLAVTGARLLRARIAAAGSSLTENAHNTIWYDSAQACNASLAQDGSKRTAFLDFGGKPGRKFAGENYATHQRILVADSSGKLVQTLRAPAGYTFDHSEWAGDGETSNIVAALTNADGAHTKIVLVSPSDSSVLELAEGEELWHPCLWVKHKVIIPPVIDDTTQVVDTTATGIDFELAPDSAGMYYNNSGACPYAVDYRYKMEILWRYKDLANVVVLGSSRALYGIDPMGFDKSVFAINLATPAGSIYGTGTYFYNYILPHVQRMKVLILALDLDRAYNTGRNANNMFHNAYKSYPGYVYDRNHDYWAEGFPKTLSGATYESPGDAGEADYYRRNRGFLKKYGDGWGSPKVVEDSCWMDSRYEDFQNNYGLLRNLIDTCAAHGIKLVGVLTPLNPRYKETGAFGYRGLRRSDATRIIHELDSLSGVYPNFILMDENKMGNHDYTNEMAMDNSHLSPRGAEQLTHRIDSLIKTLNIDFEN
ncbi:TIGR02171 family lipoprotein [Fibrobacter sp.]